MTDVYFAFGAPRSFESTFTDWDWEGKPVKILVSFFYIELWRQLQERMKSRPSAMMLDSGAFSAWNSGKMIDIESLIVEAKRKEWNEIVALDVVGDHHASELNTKKMRDELGSRVMPVFHIGDPWGVLDRYCEYHPKVGLSCRFGEPKSVSLRWLDQCFARRWPHRFHSFGWIDKDALCKFPFASCDAISWARPVLFGSGRCFGKFPLRRWSQSLRFEIEVYLEMERMLKHQWGRSLDKISDPKGSTLASNQIKAPALI